MSIYNSQEKLTCSKSKSHKVGVRVSIPVGYERSDVKRFNIEVRTVRANEEINDYIISSEDWEIKSIDMMENIVRDIHQIIEELQGHELRLGKDLRALSNSHYPEI